ncbi:Hypothetical predicted protein [Lecanosticta acicola]|uniref:Uncharacterized protein n=1 Tax=Lecanosticta acicola TaxID=111012 RepID=A0AAI8YTD4_9PEZI|nr:Hypothetical predicted protein [Lecanosticta acicola]
MYKYLPLALAAFASALPAPQSGSTVGAQPDKSSEFSLAMTVDGSFVSLTAVSNGTSGSKVLQAGRLSVYPGSPAYLNTTGEHNGYSAINFDLEDGIYGASLPDAGDNYGHAASATAILGYQEFEWIVTNGTVSHKLDAALNKFYACKDTAAGEENFFLKWGTASTDSQPPVNCQSTQLVQNFNVEGGAKGSDA